MVTSWTSLTIIIPRAMQGYRDSLGGVGGAVQIGRTCHKIGRNKESQKNANNSRKARPPPPQTYNAKYIIIICIIEQLNICFGSESF